MRARLVEPKTLHNVSVYAQMVKRKSNGENIIRCVILAVMVFIVVQLFQKRLGLSDDETFDT